MFTRLIQILLMIVVGVVLYFSWLPDPNFIHETYLPEWLLRWSNHYYNLRTAVPFVVLGFLLEAYNNQKGITEDSESKVYDFIHNMCLATMVVCIAEAGQLLIQRRSPDIADVFFGIMGSIIGTLFYNLFKRLKNA